MSTKTHRKHDKLVRPELGFFGRNEIALVGAPCSLIQQLATNTISTLSENYNIMYVDADHKAFDDPPQSPYLKDGATAYLLDQQTTEGLQFSNRLSVFDKRQLFSSHDLVLVNGNHFEAKHQIVFLDNAKQKSLNKRVAQLTNVLAFVPVDIETPWDELQEAIPHWRDIPMLKADDKVVTEHVQSWLEQRKPVLKALILAGGKSTRMGKDKANIKYHDTTQTERMANLAKTVTDEVYVSCRPNQERDYGLPIIQDTIEGLGPMGGILSAFREDPNAAWLVLACDLPFMDKDVVTELVSSRSIKHCATAFENQATGFAEPLISIWEPKSYSKLLQFLAMGYSCPRKVLINSDTHLIQPRNPEKLSNVNTPEEYEEAVQKIEKH